MIILGVHDGHNSSAALLINGEIVNAVQEERFTRLKNQFGFPKESINWLLRHNKIETSDVTRVVYCNLHMTRGGGREYVKQSYEHSEDFSTKVKLSIYQNTPLKRVYRGRRKSERIDELLKLGFKKEQITFEEHHHLHAASAYYGWGKFDEKVLVLTVDGQGDGLCGTVNIGENGTLERIAAIPQDDSFGNMYGMVTYLMGMVPLEHEYKVMGLAPYASEGTFKRGTELFDGLFEIGRDSLVWKRKKLPPALSGVQSYRKFLKGARFDEIAAGAQIVIEQIMERWVQNCIRKTGITNVTLSGGVAMNVKANKKVMEIDELKSLFIMPSAGDESNAIGACYSQFVKEGGNISDITPLAGLYLGPEYDPDAYLHMLNESDYEIAKTADPHTLAGKMVAENEIVAVCTGPTEFGARALGNRTIVSNASKLENVPIINDMIKGRDFWMPFAPSILSENLNDYVVNPKGVSAPYMILTFETTDRRNEIVAALHRYDSTTRPQEVMKDWNPDYHRLIDTYKQKSGIGGLLNTSFNLHGLPIVNTPEDAFLVLNNSGLEHLVLDGYMVSKRK